MSLSEEDLIIRGEKNPHGLHLSMKTRVLILGGLFLVALAACYYVSLPLMERCLARLSEYTSLGCDEGLVDQDTNQTQPEGPALNESGLGDVDQDRGFLVWNRTFDVYDPGSAYSVVPSGDGGFVIYGYLCTSAFRDRVPPRNTTLLKVDSEGNMVWVRPYSRKGSDGRDIASPNEFSSQALVQSGDGGFVVTARSCPKPTHDLSEFCDMYIFKVDANGDVVWEKTYETSTANCITRSEGGGFIISGSLVELPWPRSRTVEYVLKIGSEGDKVWDKTYPGKSVSGEIIESEDGGYFLLGADNHGPTIMKVDSEGNMIWYKTYPSVPESHPETITRSDEGFIVAGYQYQDMGSWTKKNLYLLGVDQNANKLWEKIYSKDNHLEARDIIPDGDGLIVAGTYGQEEQPWGNIYLLKIDSRGNQIWETTIPYCRDADAIAESGDGGFVLVGRDEFYVAKIKGTPPYPMAELPLSAAWSMGLITGLVGCYRRMGTSDPRYDASAHGFNVRKLSRAALTATATGVSDC